MYVCNDRHVNADSCLAMQHAVNIRWVKSTHHSQCEAIIATTCYWEVLCVVNQSTADVTTLQQGRNTYLVH